MHPDSSPEGLRGGASIPASEENVLFDGFLHGPGLVPFPARRENVGNGAHFFPLRAKPGSRRPEVKALVSKAKGQVQKDLALSARERS